MKRLSLAILMAIVVAWGASPLAANVFNMPSGLTSLELVTVGNTAPDSTGSSLVDYVYNIGKFEVTAGQYCELLNAVAATDAYGLYNTDMSSTTYGCNIRRTGTSGSYSYSVAADWADRPVTHVSWGDAARFANWLTNGQPQGAQGPSTSEDGSYTLNGANSDAELMAVTRNAGARYVIPTQNEWYKAAYYDGDAGVYYDYPTGTDTVPSNDLIDPDPGNNANFRIDDDYTIGSPYWKTEVGEFENSKSPYGTFDQGGNVWEWHESMPSPLYRGLRGGSFYDMGNMLHRASRYATYPTDEIESLGFRVAEVPAEVPGPATLGLLGLGGLALLRGRRRFGG